MTLLVHLIFIRVINVIKLEYVIKRMITICQRISVMWTLKGNI